MTWVRAGRFIVNMDLVTWVEESLDGDPCVFVHFGREDWLLLSLEEADEILRLIALDTEPRP